MNRIHHSMRES